MPWIDYGEEMCVGGMGGGVRACLKDKELGIDQEVKYM